MRIDVGATWNESEAFADPLTGRAVRRLSTQGRINQTPTYHTNSGFTADGRFLVFVTVRDATWVVRAEVATGELKALWRAPGVGDRNYIHRGMGLTFPDVDGRGICGNRVCVAPRSGRAVFTCERSLYAVDIETCQATVILEDIGPEWIFGAPAVDPAEEWAAVALSSAHPEILAGREPTRRYIDFPDHRLRYIRAALDGSGRVEVLYERENAQSAHCAFSPTDGNLLYFDLDVAPLYWGGGDGKTPRIRLLDIAAHAERPLKEDYPGRFQTHQAWLWDGSGICYHGNAAAGGKYVGIASVAGETLWERVLPDARHYGHNTPDPRRPALVIDGEVSADKLQWIYYDEPKDAPGPPRIEPIAVHATEWGSLPGQYSHPHPLVDPHGRWISYTVARGGRSDVCAVAV